MTPVLVVNVKLRREQYKHQQPVSSKSNFGNPSNDSPKLLLVTWSNTMYKHHDEI